MELDQESMTLADSFEEDLGFSKEFLRSQNKVWNKNSFYDMKWRWKSEILVFWQQKKTFYFEAFDSKNWLLGW